MKKEKNVPHSIAVRLLQRAKTEGESNEYLLLRYGVERLLYRLSRSAEGSRFLLKGASLFLVWRGRSYRPTKDLDLLGYGSPDPVGLVALFRHLCQEDRSQEDGLVFLPDSVRAEQIKEEQDYEGVRIRLRALLQNARIDLQVDIGFGDCVVPPAVEADFPTLLDAPAPRLRVYPLEVAFAEKLEAVVSLGLANSRLKDYFDLWLLAQSGLPEGTLVQAIRATFRHRGTMIPTETPSGLTPAYARNPDRLKQWAAFRKRVSADACPASFEQIVSELALYVMPLLGRNSLEKTP